MDKELDKIINHIKDMNGNSSDINVRYFNIHKEKVAFMFLESVASDDKISNYIENIGAYITTENRNYNYLIYLFF